MEMIFLTFFLTIATAIAIWLLPDKPRQPKHNSGGISAVFKRMADYDTTVVDLPGVSEPLLRQGVKVQINGLPCVDKTSDVGAYAAENLKAIIFRRLQSGNKIELQNVKPHEKFFGFKADIFVDGENVSEGVNANFIPPPVKPVFSLPQAPAVPAMVSKPVNNNGDHRYERNAHNA